eukprot:TRINITY_DN2329_c0_g1_i1.p1 TRINITY_DN2329_c0_g1~~TRINITY_DN2329_c0_g1_i1.p1  ORF type:complete len:261 (-),score=36.78 TRINITY_DN2329_c0_g1_i1:14-796(-)
MDDFEVSKPKSDRFNPSAPSFQDFNVTKPSAPSFQDFNVTKPSAPSFQDFNVTKPSTSFHEEDFAVAKPINDEPLPVLPLFDSSYADTSSGSENIKVKSKPSFEFPPFDPNIDRPPTPPYAVKLREKRLAERAKDVAAKLAGTVKLSNMVCWDYFMYSIQFLIWTIVWVGITVAVVAIMKNGLDSGRTKLLCVSHVQWDQDKLCYISVGQGAMGVIAIGEVAVGVLAFGQLCLSILGGCGQVMLSSGFIYAGQVRTHVQN